jgi:hypothetical protein
MGLLWNVRLCRRNIREDDSHRRIVAAGFTSRPVMRPFLRCLPTGLNALLPCFFRAAFYLAVCQPLILAPLFRILLGLPLPFRDLALHPL